MFTHTLTHSHTHTRTNEHVNYCIPHTYTRARDNNFGCQYDKANQGMTKIGSSYFHEGCSIESTV